jgi:hypothetical protein
MLAFRGRARWRDCLTGFAVATLLGLVLYAPLAGQVYAVLTRPPSVGVGVATHGWALREALRGLQTGLGGAGLAFAATLSAVGGWNYWRRQRIAFWLFVLPGVTTALATFVLGTTTRPRFFFLLIGFGALFAVRGALQAGDWWGRRRASPAASRMTAATAIVLVLVAANVASLGFLYRYPKQDYEGALAWIDRSARQGDIVATAGLATFPYASFYQRGWTEVTTPSALDALRDRGPRLRVVYAFPEYMHPDLAGLLQRECRDRRAFKGTVGGGDVIVCTIPARPAGS